MTSWSPAANSKRSAVRCSVRYSSFVVTQLFHCRLAKPEEAVWLCGEVQARAAGQRILHAVQIHVWSGVICDQQILQFLVFLGTRRRIHVDSTCADQGIGLVGLRSRPTA